MQHFFKSSRIAFPAAATLVVASMLSSAMAEGGGRAARKSGQPAWYRLWNDLDASQHARQLQVSYRHAKTTRDQNKVPADLAWQDVARKGDEPTNVEASRAERPADGARWFNVADTESSDNGKTPV